MIHRSKSHSPFSAGLQQEGLVQHIGLSTVSQKQFEEAQSIAKIICVQNYYNVAHREDEAFVDYLNKHGVAYVPYFPLGGFTPLQSSHLNDARRSAQNYADGGGAGVAVAPVAKHSAYTWHIFGGAPARESFGSDGSNCQRISCRP